MKAIILDGAMGTNLIAAGMPKGVNTEEWVLDNCDVVKGLQGKYFEAGSDIIYAPTFGANPSVLAREGKFGVDINARLVALTKSVVEGSNTLVAGDISSTGLMLKPYGSADFESVSAIFAEQAKALDDAGVDVFVIETSISLKEATAAYYGVRSVSDKPVFVTFTLEKGCRTLSGEAIEACLVALQSKGAFAVGVNCSDGGENVKEAVKRMAEYALIPIIAKPNAGLPTVVGDKVVYNLSPEDFAEFCSELAAEGASYLGGCCGTTPAHIAALCKCAPEVNVPIARDGIFATDGRDVFEIDKKAPLPEVVECDDFLLFNLPEPDEAAYFRINAADTDAARIVDETPLCGLPLMINGADAETLDAVLRVYPGRAVLDPEAEISKDEAEALKNKYGLIIF